MVNIFLNGCCGRMGHTIAKMCQHNDEYRVVAGCDVTTCDDFSFPVYNNPQDCAEDFDVIIDFSNAKAVPTILNYALSKNKPFICCTTALSDDTVADLLKASETIPVFKSANMSVGINLMLELVKKCTKTLYPEYDIEIVEAHHNRKLDAPSGTAMMIANAISQEIPEEVDYVYEPGQFSLRGSIVDVFSYNNELPYRIDFFGTRGHVTGNEVTEGGIAALQIVVAILLRNIPSLLRSSLQSLGVLQLLGHPDTAVVAERLRHQCQL